MKRRPLKRTSERFRRRAANAREFRLNLVVECGRCEICGAIPGQSRFGRPKELSDLSVHEIANGSDRQKALDKRYACLVVCWHCNSNVLTDKRLWPQARQLYYLKRHRPRDYNLKAFNSLVGFGPDRITEDDVRKWEN